MNIYLEQYNLQDVDVDNLEIDIDSFYESILTNIVRIRSMCLRIDNQIVGIAAKSYVPVMTTLEQCEAIVDLTNVKIKFMRLYRAFIRWYKKLSNNEKRIFLAYFIKKDNKEYKQLMRGHYRKKFIIPMVRNFKNHITMYTDIQEKELIKHPSIYSFYTTTYERNMKNKKKGVRKDKGESVYDSTADERCHS